MPPEEIGIQRFQRFHRIDTVLDSCLNWQESVAIAKYGELDCGKRATVSDVAATAFEKKSFLQDALIYFLRGEPCDFYAKGATAADFIFQDAVLPLLNDDAKYFYALALAKVFRARMSTRCGHRHGLSWGSRFSYQRCLTTYGDLFPLRRRRLAAAMSAARRDCFITPPVNNRTPAAELAVRLLRSAQDFVRFYDEALSDAQQDVLRDAVLARRYDPLVLLKVWTIGCSGVYNLPMDALWTRAHDCAYTTNCVGYDEFVALTHAQAQHSQEAQRKVGLLKEAENNRESEWRGVARNWWCHGFMRGMYSWKSAVKVDKDIVADVQAVVDRIRSDNLYERVKEASAVRDLLCKKVEEASAVCAVQNLPMTREACEASAVQNLFIPMIREACEGARPRDIAHRFGINTLSSVYSFLFLVATTQKTPKLQDCWMR